MTLPFDFNSRIKTLTASQYKRFDPKQGFLPIFWPSQVRSSILVPMPLDFVLIKFLKVQTVHKSLYTEI